MKVEKTIVCFVLIICFVGLTNPVSPSVWNSIDTTATLAEEVQPEKREVEYSIESRSQHNLSDADGYSEEFQRQHDARATQTPGQKTPASDKYQRNL